MCQTTLFALLVKSTKHWINTINVTSNRFSLIKIQLKYYFCIVFVCYQDASAKLIKKRELKMSTGIKNGKHVTSNISIVKLISLIFILFLFSAFSPVNNGKNG